MTKTLKNSTESLIRFSEVDSMQVVWHGNYVKYLEDGREAFGIQYGLGYYDVFAHNLMTPIVKVELDYKRMVKYNDVIRIETELVQTDAAKIIFNYKIYNKSTNQLALTASTTQVFINLEGELQLTNPQFYLDWQKIWGLLE